MREEKSKLTKEQEKFLKELDEATRQVYGILQQLAHDCTDRILELTEQFAGAYPIEFQLALYKTFLLIYFRMMLNIWMGLETITGKKRLKEVLERLGQETPGIA